MALSNAERQARYRERHKVQSPHPPKPKPAPKAKPDPKAERDMIVAKKPDPSFAQFRPAPKPSRSPSRTSRSGHAG